MIEATTLPDTRTKLLDAALMVIRTKGYAGTSVDDLCHAAGVTKGAFFHHFKSKEEMAVAAAAHFGAMAEGLFSQAGYRTLADPLERLLAYVETQPAPYQLQKLDLLARNETSHEQKRFSRSLSVQ